MGESSKTLKDESIENYPTKEDAHYKTDKEGSETETDKESEPENIMVDIADISMEA